MLLRSSLSLSHLLSIALSPNTGLWVARWLVAFMSDKVGTYLPTAKDCDVPTRVQQCFYRGWCCSFKRVVAAFCGVKFSGQAASAAFSATKDWLRKMFVFLDSAALGMLFYFFTLTILAGDLLLLLLLLNRILLLLLLNDRGNTQVVAMVVSAAERDGVRDDRYFSFAIKTLARMGRLDLSLRVNEMRER